MTTILITLLVAVTLGGGVSAAAQNDMPGDALYKVKIASERVRLAFTAEAKAKTDLSLEFASRRTAEAEAIANGEVKVPTSVALEVLTSLKEELQAANETAVEARAKADAKASADLSTKLFITARGIDTALDRIEAKVQGEVKEAAAAASVQAQAAVNAALEARARAEAEERAKINAQAEGEARASAEGKIGAAQNRLDAGLAHATEMEARLGAEATAEANAKLNAATTLLSEARAKLEAGAFVEAFAKAQESMRMSNEATVSLSESVRLLLPEVKMETEGEANAEAGASAETKGPAVNVEGVGAGGMKVELE